VTLWERLRRRFPGRDAVAIETAVGRSVSFGALEAAAGWAAAVLRDLGVAKGDRHHRAVGGGDAQPRQPGEQRRDAGGGLGACDAATR
jgi:hypothetical protein